MRTRSLVLVAAVGLALGAIGTWLVLTSDHLENKAAFLSLALTVGLSFLVSGVIALWRRPDNRTGLLLVLVAYLWFLGGLTESDNDWVFTIGVLVNSLALGAFVQLLLAYPTGRLQGRRDLWLVVSTYTLVFVGSLAQLLVDEQPDSSCTTCTSTIAVTSSDTAHTLVRGIVSVLALALVVVVLAIVVTRYLRARGALRRALGPVLGTGALVMVVLFVQLVVDTVSEDAADPLYFVFLVTFALVPVAFLAGVLRSRLARSGVADLLVELGRGVPLRDAVAHSLRDPSLDLVYWLPEREQLVLPDGTPVSRATTASACGTTCRRNGQAGRRAHPRPLARGRARARRRGRRGGGALARERAAAGRAARAVRLPRDDREHGAVAADVARTRRPDRQLQHGLRARERLRERRGRPPRVLLGRLHLAGRARRGARALREEPGTPTRPPGRTRSSTGAARRW